MKNENDVSIMKDMEEDGILNRSFNATTDNAK